MTRRGWVVLAAVWCSAGGVAEAAQRPDLTVSKLSASPVVTAGATLTVSETTRNVGRAVARSSTTTYFLSRDAKRNAADTRLAKRTVGRLRGGRTSSAKTKLRIPASVTGTRYVLACADAAGLLRRELSEKNNCRAFKVTVRSAAGPPAVTGTGSAAMADESSSTPSPAPVPAPAPPPSTTRPVVEVEPNETRDQADERAANDGVVVKALPASIPGTITYRAASGGRPEQRDTDLLRIEVAATTGLRLDVRGALGGPCSGSADPELLLRAADATVLASNDDVHLTKDRCARIAISVRPGVYYAEVTGTSDSAFAYVLGVIEQPAAIPLSSDPASPSTETAPRVYGEATSGAVVRLFDNARCSGTPLTNGTAAAFALPGLAISVPPESAMRVHAQATLGTVKGACSTTWAGYANAVPEATAGIDREGLRGGTVGAGDALDTYTFTAPSVGQYLFAAYDASSTGCAAPTDTRLVVRGPGGDVLADSDAGTLGPCGEATLLLGVQSHTLEVHGTGTYVLRVGQIPESNLNFFVPASGEPVSLANVHGSATAGSRIEVFARTGCNGRVRATGTAEQLAADGIPTFLGENRLRQLSIRAVRNGVAQCSLPRPYQTGAGVPTPTFTESGNDPSADVNDTPQAALASQGAFMGPVDVVRASHDSSVDVDHFVFGVSSEHPQVVRIEQYDDTGGDCRLPGDTTMQLFPESGPSVTDDDGGIGTCPALVHTLDPGLHVLQMREKPGQDAAGSYRLVIRRQTTTIAESEGNGGPDDADALIGPEVVATGTIAGEDEDWFRVTVPDGDARSVRAQVAGPCEATVLDLFDADGAELLATGTGPCSVIDGSGVNPPSFPAQDLAAGEYLLRLRTPAGGAGSAYRLDVSLR